MGFLRRPTSKRPATLGVAIALLAILLSVATSHADNPILQGPESSSLCTNDDQCPFPSLEQGQLQECLKPICLHGSCATRILTGKPLNRSKPPVPLACYAEPVVCSDQGKEATLTDPTKRIAANEGNFCLPSQPIANPCQSARCVSSECVSSAVPDEEKLECLSPEPAAGPCEKGQCTGGACKPAPDQKKQGTSCAPVDKGLCRTTEHMCSTSGSCDPKATLDDGKECSPDPDGPGPEKALLGQPSSLPATFLALFQGGSKPPAYTCNSSNCTLEYCGNGKVDQPMEDCDGDAYRDGVARNLPCNKKTCKTGAMPPVDTCSASLFSPAAPEGVTILSEDFLICGTKGAKACEDMQPAAEARKTELLSQGYNAVVTSGYVTCNPWNNNPCPAAEPARWSLKESRVCYYSHCGDGKLTPNEECDGTTFRDEPPKGATCDPKTCKVVERQCTWVAAWANWGLAVAGRINSGQDRDEVLSLLNYTEGNASEDWKSVPSCFLQQYQNWCKQKKDGEGYVTFGSCSGLTPSMFASFLGVPEEVADLAICNYSGPSTGRGRQPGESAREVPDGCKPDPYTPIQFYMDENCRYTLPTGNETICGFAGTSWSPISLLLSRDVPLEKDNTVVQFPLDPHLPASFSLWKASESSPLLVYDPDGTGAVASARQLFGNYAFGGKTTNIADAKSSALRSPWSNGYEALGLLDTDHNDIVSGDELQPLALWLDKNRNGVSEKGEVVRVSDFGITQIFYKNSKIVPNSKDLELDTGFTRVVDGKEVSGPSVDWFGETFTNRLEAAQALEAKLYAAKPRAAIEALVRSLPEELRGNPLTFKPHQATDHSSDLSGYWLWHTRDDSGAKHPGVFVLEQKGDRVVGYSVVEAILAKNEKGLKSSVRIIPAEGTVTVSPKGDRTLTMRLIDVTGEGTAVSTATLTAIGNSLSGKTKQEIISQISESPQSVSTEYEWTAIKFASENAKK